MMSQPVLNSPDNLSTGARLDPAATLKLIAAYKPVDVVSAYYQQQFQNLITAHPDMFANRYNYQAGIHGHLTAQAIVYNPDLNAIAMMHHKKLNIWVGAGGHIDLDDADPIVAAKREAAEEIGLTDLVLADPAPFDIDIHGFPAKKDQPDHLHYDLRFLFTTTSNTLIANDESTDLKWVKITELRQFLPNWLSNSRLVLGLEKRFG
jgi:8-oxo-dGTP pyrophosphatase MutT (NUDIX family)